MRVFGSCVHGTDRPDSDVDLLVRALPKALLIDLATACAEPDLWRAVKRTRDRMAHHYRDTSYPLVWETLVEDVPRVLGALPDD